MISNTAKPEIANADHHEKDGLACAANQAGQKLRGIFTHAGDEISHMSDSVTSEIRSNPIRSSAIALGVGVLLGALLRR